MRPLLTFALYCSCGLLAAQSAPPAGPWTLGRAVEYATNNNLQVRGSAYSRDIAELNLGQARRNRLPNVSGSSNVSYQLGRTVDPTSNSFAQQNILSQNISVQGSQLLYGGGQIANGIRQGEVDYRAAQLDYRVAANDVALQVANSFLSVVLLREQLTNARQQLALTEEQLANTEKLIRAGSVPGAERYDILATRATNQSTIVSLENQERQALLDLQLLLELDPRPDFDLVAPDLAVSEEELFGDYETARVLEAARTTQPTIQAAQLREESARLGEEVARAALRPTVSLFANLSTNYSNLARRFTEGSTIFVPTEVQFMDNVTTIGFPQRTGTFDDVGYLDQLNENFGQLVGVSLNVPIYGQGRNRNGVALARVQRLQAELQREQATNQLRSDVERALNDLRAARESYRAAGVALEAARVAYDNTDRRFRAGAGNSLELTTASNRLEQARTELTRSKFQLLFNREVIQFYLGQGLSLD